MLTYTEEGNEVYTIWLAEDGEEIHLANGSFQRLVPFDNIDLKKRWDKYQLYSGYISDRDGWIEWLRRTIDEPEVADEVKWCDDCNYPGHEDGFHAVTNGFVCEDCFTNYQECGLCSEDVHEDGGRTVLSGSFVCQGCVDNYYGYCEACDGYFNHNEESSEHEHDETCDCESPGMQFTVRNNGKGMLAQDERTQVSLPAGIIDEQGIQAIARKLWGHAVDLDDDDQRRALNALAYPENIIVEIGDKWQTGKGNFTKRLSKLAYEAGVKLPPEVISAVGVIGSDHSQAVDFEVEVTRDLNLSAEDFGNEGSCWWGSYDEGRCAFKSNGGYGLRAFDEYHNVIGRAWVMPLKNPGGADLVPTFETASPDAFVVFNGYGELCGYTSARIVAHMAGLTYRKISLYGSPMYINGESGYLIAPEDLAKHYTDGRLHLSVDEHSSLFTDERKVLTHVA